MSIRILQPGLLDTVQDAGRTGYQHLGINPAGAMDRVAMYVANSLVGNAPTEAVIEMHFPSAAVLFEEFAMIALSGADLGAMVNDQPVAINKPVLMTRQAVLRFTRPVSGACCYLAVRHGLNIPAWLGSSSTHLKAGAGGFKGRALQKNDVLPMRQVTPYNKLLQQHLARELPWRIGVQDLYTGSDHIRVTTGNGFALLDEHSQQLLTSTSFAITQQSDRMGFRLQGHSLKLSVKTEALSAGVTRGTIQLLPNGQLIILMADQQTTGGYARLAHVITADQPSLAQMKARQHLYFDIIPHAEAEALLWQQDQRLQLLQNACKLRLEEWLSQYGLH